VTRCSCNGSGVAYDSDGQGGSIPVSCPCQDERDAAAALGYEKFGTCVECDRKDWGSIVNTSGPPQESSEFFCWRCQEEARK
jgi:hypothetical protein